MAAQIKKDTGLDAQLEVGSSGEFTVWVGETKVAEKSFGKFPDPRDVVTAVREAVAPRSP